MKLKSVHPLQWIADPLEAHATFAQKKMFGCEAFCLYDRQMLVVAAKDEPWNGLLVCTSLEHQASLTKTWPALKPHSILKKWLYISQTHEQFETIAQEIARTVLRDDFRVGVVSKPKKCKKRS